jgi:lipopolysaccharide export system permease protein
MFTLLDRYITKRLLDYFFLGMVVFTLVLFFSDALLDFMKDLQHYGIPWDIAFTIIGLQIPRIVSIIIPMSALLATLMVYSTLNNQLELIAMRMSGIGLYRLARPALMLGIGAAVLTFALHDYVTPSCNKLARALKSYAINQQNLPATQENFTYKQFDDSQQLRRLLYISHFEHNQLGYSTVIDLTNPATLQVIQARSGAWTPEAIELKDANVYTVSTNQKLTNTTHANHLALQHFVRPEREVNEYQPRELSFIGMLGWLEQQRKKGKHLPAEIYVTLWEKVLVPLSALPLVLVAVPLAMTSPRKLNNMGFLVAVLILFLYYLIRHVSVQMGEHEVLDPLLAASLPFLIISLAAGLLYHRKNRIL